MKSVITVQCPECRGTLEIDVARQRVLSHRPHLDADAPGRDKAALFDDVVKRIKDRESEAEDAFERAQREAKERESKLEKLFGDAKKKVQDQKDSGEDLDTDPRNIFWD